MCRPIFGKTSASTKHKNWFGTRVHDSRYIRYEVLLFILVLLYRFTLVLCVFLLRTGLCGPSGKAADALVARAVAAVEGAGRVVHVGSKHLPAAAELDVLGGHVDGGELGDGIGRLLCGNVGGGLLGLGGEAKRGLAGPGLLGLLVAALALLGAGLLEHAEDLTGNLGEQGVL